MYTINKSRRYQTKAVINWQLAKLSLFKCLRKDETSSAFFTNDA